MRRRPSLSSLMRNLIGRKVRFRTPRLIKFSVVSHLFILGGHHRNWCIKIPILATSVYRTGHEKCEVKRLGHPSIHEASLKRNHGSEEKDQLDRGLDTVPIYCRLFKITLITSQISTTLFGKFGIRIKTLRRIVLFHGSDASALDGPWLYRPDMESR